MIKIRSGSYKALGKLIVGLGTKQARAATSRAISRAATTVTKEGVKIIREKRLVKLPAADLKAMFSTRMKLKGDIRSMYATIMIANRAISLAKFWPKKVNPPKGMQRVSKVGHGHKLKAVKVTVMGRTVLAGAGRAFLVGNSTRGVIFMRTGRKRTPIKKLFGPSVSDLVIYTGIRDQLQRIGEERLATVLGQELAFRTEKLKAVRA